jgi:hypothetical protein
MQFSIDRTRTREEGKRKELDRSEEKKQRRR